MRNVSRPQLPMNYISRYMTPWKDELIRALDATGDGKWASLDRETQRTASKRWKSSKIKAALKTMYDDQCSYCECSLKIRGEVEHLWPRVRYPKKALDWDNLHWACPRCNGIKSKTDRNFDGKYPLLDPSSDNPIEDFLVYDANHVLSVLTPTINKKASKAQKKRAKNTIEALYLDDDELSNQRYNFSHRIQKLWEQYGKETDAKNRAIISTTLKNVFEKKQFQSVKEYTIKEYEIVI